VCPFNRSEQCFSFSALKVSPCWIFVVVTIFRSYLSCSEILVSSVWLKSKCTGLVSPLRVCHRSPFRFCFSLQILHAQSAAFHLPPTCSCFQSPVFVFVRSPRRQYFPARAQTHRFLLPARATSPTSIFHFHSLAPGLSAIWVSRFLAPVGSCSRQG
jgi:hypothetical protein